MMGEEDEAGSGEADEAWGEQKASLQAQNDEAFGLIAADGEEAERLLKGVDAALEQVDEDALSEGCRAELLSLRCSVYTNFACLLVQHDRCREAVPLLRSVLDIEDELGAPRAQSHLNMAATLSAMGRHRSALRHCSLAVEELEQQQQRQDEEEEDDDGRQLLPVAFFNLAAEHEHLRQVRPALRAYEEAERHASAHGNAQVAKAAKKARRELLVEHEALFTFEERFEAAPSHKWLTGPKRAKKKKTGSQNSSSAVEEEKTVRPSRQVRVQSVAAPVTPRRQQQQQRGARRPRPPSSSRRTPRRPRSARPAEYNHGGRFLGKPQKQERTPRRRPQSAITAPVHSQQQQRRQRQRRRRRAKGKDKNAPAGVYDSLRSLLKAAIEEEGQWEALFEPQFAYTSSTHAALQRWRSSEGAAGGAVDEDVQTTNHTDVGGGGGGDEGDEEEDDEKEEEDDTVKSVAVSPLLTIDRIREDLQKRALQSPVTGSQPRQLRQAQPRRVGRSRASATSQSPQWTSSPAFSSSVSRPRHLRAQVPPPMSPDSAIADQLLPPFHSPSPKKGQSSSSSGGRHLSGVSSIEGGGSSQSNKSSTLSYSHADETETSRQ